MVSRIIPIILCGGMGRRLWPKSRDVRPKQFANFDSDFSLLQETALRFSKERMGIAPSAPIIVGADRFGDLIAEELAQINVDCRSIILEPFGMDSAPALAVSLIDIVQEEPDAICCMLPSDHAISNLDGFYSCLSMAIKTIEQLSWIVTLGIDPTHAETQYGYIERDGTAVDSGAYKVKQFHEKPELDRAEAFLASGSFYWNSGMFFFRARDMAHAFQTHAPQTWEYARKAVEHGSRNGKLVALNDDAFAKCEKQSIDYAIMEKIQNLGVVPSQFTWSDLGAWGQIYENSPEKDDDGNVLVGDIVSHDLTNSFVSAKTKLVAVAGLSDVMVVEDGDAILVLDRHKGALVKNLVDKLNSESRRELLDNSEKFDLSSQLVRQWLVQDALPFWAKHGLDKKSGGVYEHIAFDGSPVDDVVKRFRVLPRQIYCFAEGKILASENDVYYEPILRSLFEHMVRTAWHEEGGWVHMLNCDGSVQNPLRDTYDQCFVLLACASLQKATGWPEARQWADKTLQWMDDNLADPINGGYFENSEQGLPRRANPHMHFLEAMLAWYQITQETQFLDRAERIVELFENHLFNQEHGVLAEFFDARWQELEDAASQLVEPGHHYEWATLMLQFDALRPRHGLRQKALRLIAHARAFGHLPNGVVRNYVARDGSLPEISGIFGLKQARCWQQTEAIKAAIECQKLGLCFAKPLAQEMLEHLFSYYLIGVRQLNNLHPDEYLAGGWIDALDENGDAISSKMPSSTFYHIVSALKLFSN